MLFGVDAKEQSKLAYFKRSRTWSLVPLTLRTWLMLRAPRLAKNNRSVFHTLRFVLLSLSRVMRNSEVRILCTVLVIPCVK